MSERPTLIMIEDARFPRWMRQLVTMLSLCVGPIGVGVATGSAAMQWVGFLFSVLLFFAFAKGDASRTTFASIEDAERYLAELKGRP